MVAVRAEDQVGDVAIVLADDVDEEIERAFGDIDVVGFGQLFGDFGG